MKKFQLGIKLKNESSSKQLNNLPKQPKAPKFAQELHIILPKKNPS